VEELVESQKACRSVLFLYGPIGCGKTVTINVLFKGFNIIHIDSSDLRSNDKISKSIRSIVGVKDVTLENIEKWNHKTRKEKLNVVVVDNIELCEKNITQFVDLVHNKHEINIPILLICNNPKYKDLFYGQSNFQYLEFKKPSLLELTKLVTNVNIRENLNLTKDNIRALIEASLYDTRQVFFVLEQWKLRASNFEEFIQTLQTKYSDIDLTNKLLYCFDPNKSFDFRYTLKLACSEPITISLGIFQNYLGVLEYLDAHDPGMSMDTASKIVEDISRSGSIHQKIFEDQCWNLYEDYALHSCVLPSHHIKQTASQINTQLNVEKDLYYKIAPFKDLSYNFMNSLEEVRRVCTENVFCKKINPNGRPHKVLCRDLDSCFSMTRLFLTQLKIVNAYFDTNKRGKNTSKKEKLDICDSIIVGPTKDAFDYLVDKIYSYKLFEVNIDDIIMNIKQFQDVEYLKEQVGCIDLRVLKRFLNIFTFDDSNNLLKSHVETALKYKVLEKLVVDMRENVSTNARLTNKIENLMEDLDKIWKLG
jgi:DNA polymerase III delta prime subunit